MRAVDVSRRRISLTDPDATVGHDRRDLLQYYRGRMANTVAGRTGRQGNEGFVFARFVGQHDERPTGDDRQRIGNHRLNPGAARQQQPQQLGFGARVRQPARQ